MTYISIVIRTKNEGKNIQHTLEKVYSQKIDKDFEVIIIDSGSTDNTLEIAKKFNCRILIIPPEKFTYPYALNFATAYANGEIVVYLSAHSPPVDNYWLYHLTKHFFDCTIAAVRGRDIPIKGDNPTEEYCFLQSYPDLPNSIDFDAKSIYKYTNGNTAIRKSIWEKYKHPETFCYKIHLLLMGEDQVWASYLLKKGYRIVYEPQSKVYHSHKFTLKRVWLISYSSGYFSKDLHLPVSLSNRFSGKAIITSAISNKKALFYFLKNRYFKTFFFDYPLSLITGMIAPYCGKKAREKDEKLFGCPSFKYNPDNSNRLSDNPCISNSNQSIRR